MRNPRESNSFDMGTVLILIIIALVIVVGAVMIFKSLSKPVKVEARGVERSDKKTLTISMIPSRAILARVLGILAIAIDIVAVLLAIALSNFWFFYFMIAGQWLFLFSFFLYRTYGRIDIMDTIIHIVEWIILLPTFIFLLFAVFGSRSQNNETQTKNSKSMGQGYIQKNEYGNYELFLGNEYSGYDKISLQDYNEYAGTAKDYKGNEYRF